MLIKDIRDYKPFLVLSFENKIMETEKEKELTDKVSYICFKCKDKFNNKDEAYQNFNGETYCPSCFDELFSLCEDCEEYCPSGDTREVLEGDRIVCQNCYDESYFTCQYCERALHNDDYYENGSCCGCHRENDDDEDSMPNVNRAYDRTDDLVDKAHRAYSCEIEGYYKKADELNNVVADIHKSIGISDDGSLVNGYGKEFQTPKISGTKGDKVLKDLCKSLVKNNFYVDKSCGLHIHIDTSDMDSGGNENRKTRYEKEFINFLNMQGTRINNLIVNFSGKITWEKMIRITIDKCPYKSYTKQVIDHFKTRGIIKEILSMPNTNTKMIVLENGVKIEWDTETLEIPPSMFRTVRTSEGINSLYGIWDTDSKTGNSNYLKIKTIMLFYVAFEPVIYSYLPMSRRTNRYCLPISEFFHEKEIEKCNDIKALEKMWYREQDLDSIDNRKDDKYDSTRYCGVNMHSLFANNNIEIRFHGGTMDYNKIKMWADLHIAILDAISQGKIDSVSLRTIKYTLDLSQKQAKMFEMINLPKNIQDYFISRQATFGTTTKENENICVE